MTMTSVHALRETRPSVSLVERLIAAGLISEIQLQRALQEKARHDRPLQEILVNLGMISERMLSDVSNRVPDSVQTDLSTLLPNPDALALVSKDLAEQHCMFPIDFDARTEVLTLAVTDAFELPDLDKMFGSVKAGVSIATVVAAEAEIESAIDKFYGVALTIPEILSELDSEGFVTSDDGVTSVDCTQPLDRLLDAILFHATECGASAIHFEPEQAFVRLRYRIDGVLGQAMVLRRRHWPEIHSRLLALSATECEAKGSTTGRQTLISVGNQQQQLTVARQPSQYGADVIVRIVPQPHEVLSLNDLGLDNSALTRIRLMMARQSGLIIVAGPPDSGKTSTLFSMLSYRSDESVRIVAVGEPGTATLPLVRQVPTAEARTLVDSALADSRTFAEIDVLAVGEVHDRSVATIALRAAMAGNQVLATLTAKSASAVLPRIMDIGLTSQQISGNVIGIVAQRLVRKLCTNCRQAYSPQPFEKEILGASDSQALRLYRAGTCEHCRYVGYKGRIGLFETLVVDEELDELLARGATSVDIKRKMGADGSRQVVDEAVRQVLAGVTSLAEASRVVDLSARLV